MAQRGHKPPLPGYARFYRLISASATDPMAVAVAVLEAKGYSVLEQLEVTSWTESDWVLVTGWIRRTGGEG